MSSFLVHHSLPYSSQVLNRDYCLPFDDDYAAIIPLKNIEGLE